MTGDARRELAFDHVQIGAADAAGMYAHQHLAGIEAFRRGHVAKTQRVGFNRSASRKRARFHVSAPQVRMRARK
jgi:hypothetical protein